MTHLAHPTTWLSDFVPDRRTPFDERGGQAPGRSMAATEQGSERLPAEPALVTAHFRPLDPDIINQTIPAFFIGRNKNGFWVARDVRGKSGGTFLCEKSAVSFARTSSRSAGCVTIFPSERIELDLENNGNPLVGVLGSMMRLVERLRQRMAAVVGKMTKVVSAS